jgi:hypothetical protein
MIYHGGVVFLLGLLLGLPFGLVLLGTMEGSERAWRMAHLEGLLNGLFVIGVAAVGPALHLSAARAATVAWCMIITAYGNVVASGLAATYGVRGLSPGGSVVNTTVYVLFMIAVATVVVGMVLVTAAARRRSKNDAQEARARQQ